ncbi:uncharacterized protein LOC135675560 [Musa acuminata AAA Group]|uniref:uncharacterized protein LOC135675560 n=1 Tax=Musa acuminata AAA Group TaxID=214697 RepID=UPI0031CF4D32
MLFAYAKKHNKGGGDGYRAGEGDRWACPRVHQDRGLRHPPCLVITLTLEAPRRPHLCEGGPPWSKEKGAGYGDGEGQRVVFPPLHWAVRLLQVPHPRHPGAPRVSPHRLPLPPCVAILRLTLADAQALYRRRFAATEFFPRNIDTVLANPFSLGTFLAVPPYPVIP